MFGRLMILDLLGRGGMGEVYSAYDPRLDRKVAVKLLQPRPGRHRSKTQKINHRLLREAQALARLNHPNVITAYDVGSIGEQVFLAMEHVEGQTLRDWLRREKRAPAEILETFAAAGSGLAAAHAAGLVHRDFKPGNVMVADDGRVLVLDFGLARARHGEGLLRGEGPVIDVDTWEQSPAAPSSAFDNALTAAGTVLGTPAYMAPEQMGEGGATAKSDQFSFCVSLYEALYGSLPFERPSAASLADRNWQIRPPPSVPGVPQRVRRLLLRGLSLEPEQRYPEFELLLKDLEADPWRGRRRRFAAAAAALLLAAGAWAWHSELESRRELLCSGAEAQVATVWNDRAAAEVGERFLSFDKPYAGDVWSSARRALDARAAAWSELHRATCEATRLRGEQSERLLDLRMDCLGQRLQEMGTLVELLRGVDEDLLASSVDAVHALRPLRSCTDTRALTAVMQPPADAEKQQRVRELRRQLARVRGHLAAFDVERAGELLGEVLGQAEQLGFWPLTAEALLTSGTVFAARQEAEAAERALDRAIDAAVAGGHDEVTAEAFTRLVRVTGYLRSDFAAGHRHADHARAVLDRLSGGAWLRAELADYEGTLFYQQGDFARALEQHGLALEQRRRQSPELDTPKIGNTLARLGNVHLARGELGAAQEHFEQALAAYEESLGPSHPQVAFTLDKIGSVSLQRADYQTAAELHGRALDVASRSLGSDHQQVAVARLNLGAALHYLGRNEEALGHLEKALETFRARWGEKHAQVSFALGGLAMTLSSLGRYAEARDAYLEAFEIQEAAYGREHPWVATTIYNLGESYRKLSEFRTAVTYYRLAREVVRRTLGDGHEQEADALTGEGRSLLALGSTQEAVEVLERALAIHQLADAGSTRLAETRFALAQALRDAGADAARARALAEQARDAYRAASERYRPMLADVERWLAEAAER